jgi:hypothetical protein
MKNKLKVATVLLIFIVSGCSHYNNIPRQRSFFNAKSDEHPTKERVQFSTKNNKDASVEAKSDSVISEEITEKIAQEDRNTGDYQQIKSKDKFAFNHPNCTFIKKSIPLAKSSLPKVFKFHETKKSNKNILNKYFPFLFLGLLIIVIIVALLTRKRKRKPLPEPNPDESKLSNDYLPKPINILSILTKFFGILCLTLLILSFTFVFIQSFSGFLLFIYALTFAAVAGIIALILLIINFFFQRTYKKKRND